MVNGVILQPFQWYTPEGTSDWNLWRHLANNAKTLADKGYTAIWLPPPYKGSGGTRDVGYGAFDLFDLGEFDQKGAVPTKYGTRNELLTAIQALQRAGMQVYIDTVFNQKDGGDEELLMAQQVDPKDRNKTISEWYQIKAYTRFDYPVRAGKYSAMKWNGQHFDAVSCDANHLNERDKVFRLKNKLFMTEDCKDEYVCACDVETSNPEVDNELRLWGRWMVDTTNANGFRLDAVKHIRSGYFRDWINHIRCHFSNRELFAVAEYWEGNVRDLHAYITATQGVLSLFDVPLHYKFYRFSQGEETDMRCIFDNTLVREQPALAVTFVDNHDTQPYQALASCVNGWFKPLAYALILLRRDGYPCVFGGDLADYVYPQNPDVKLSDHSFLIDKFLWARRAYGYGDQYDYFDHPRTVGWTRLGTTEHPGAMAVILSNGDDGYKEMDVRRSRAEFYDLTGHIPENVTTDESGRGCFRCKAGKVSVWLQR